VVVVVVAMVCDREVAIGWSIGCATASSKASANG
jgi:hypothetical protein